MIKITKEEAKYLASKGVPYGENGISRTYSHHKHYYIAETNRNTKLLSDYKKSRIV